MKIALIGLGKMGSALAYRLRIAGHEVIGFDTDVAARQEFERQGHKVTHALPELVHQVSVFWFMVPAGAVDVVLQELRPLLSPGAIIIDGGNSKFSDSIQRAQELVRHDIHFLDCGVSGGIVGKEHGFALTVGGDKKIYDHVLPLLTAIASSGAVAYVGPSGAGHYVKMVHNGIEYALLQSYGEGFHLLREGRYPNLDLAEIAHVWQRAAIIRSFVLELSRDILARDQSLKGIAGEVQHTGMGQWMVEEARERNIPVKLVEDALAIRIQSKQSGTFATKLVSLLRNAFGGHGVKKK